MRISVLIQGFGFLSMLTEAKANANWRFLYRVLLPIILAVVTTLISIGSFMLWTASRNDEASISRQTELISHILDQQKALIKREQEDVVAWNKAVSAVQGTLDMDWIEENLGLSMYDFFGHDRSWVINPDLQPVYAMRDGATVPPDSFEISRSVLEPTTRRLREINWQGALSIYIYGHNDIIPSIVDIVMIEGKPAIVSQMPIATNARVGKQAPGLEYIHITAEFLDEELVSELYDILLLEGGYFSASTSVPEGEAIVPIRNLEGELITNFFWQPDKAGANVFAEIAPALVLVTLFAGLVITILVLRLHQSTTELERGRTTAQHLAYHDNLTGLGNRAMFELSLARAIADTKENENCIALLILDLDRFKQVNDTLGHQAGDELICEVAKRIKPLVRSTDVITRLGGDEYAVIINSVIASSDIAAACGRMVEAIRKPFDLEAGQAFVGVSIGVAISSDPEMSGEELTRQADIALYDAKENGRNQYKIFENHMNEAVQRRQTIETELRKALMDENQFRVIFEPLVRKSGSELIGVEAKLAWEHPSIGQIEPETFLPVAESSGLIEAVGEYLLSWACKSGSKTPGQIMAVRVFSAQLSNPEFFDRLFSIISKTGINPTDLELEIDEKTLSNAEEKATENMRKLRQAGVRIALGDFGTGFTSLRLLQQFQVDRIKISRSFIAELAQSPDPEAITHAVVWLARAIGVEVTADGIDSVEQKNFLARMGCMSFQGKLFSPAGQAEWLRMAADASAKISFKRDEMEDEIEVWDDANSA